MSLLVTFNLECSDHNVRYSIYYFHRVMRVLVDWFCPSHISFIPSVFQEVLLFYSLESHYIIGGFRAKNLVEWSIIVIVVLKLHSETHFSSKTYVLKLIVTHSYGMQSMEIGFVVIAFL